MKLAHGLDIFHFPVAIFFFVELFNSWNTWQGLFPLCELEAKICQRNLFQFAHSHLLYSLILWLVFHLMLFALRMKSMNDYGRQLEHFFIFFLGTKPWGCLLNQFPFPWHWFSMVSSSRALFFHLLWLISSNFFFFFFRLLSLMFSSRKLPRKLCFFRCLLVVVEHG